MGPRDLGPCQLPLLAPSFYLQWEETWEPPGLRLSEVKMGGLWADFGLTRGTPGLKGLPRGDWWSWLPGGEWDHTHGKQEGAGVLHLLPCGPGRSVPALGRGFSGSGKFLETSFALKHPPVTGMQGSGSEWTGPEARS